MLELKNIKKDYLAGVNTVNALKGIDLAFRKSEFVSILGPSGCGKTTMLNIIGGLDQYTEGDLIINGKSTKSFKDRDWDGYRNHSVGFVFQNYNLIPHQSVLQNVELALSLSGVSKVQRRKKAKEALEKVGLSDQLNKKPGELSGGQMQRVAIARAIVNNPDIILADEPTGALDTETSIQVMDILKEISNDRLVVMVTHNPELAEKYSTRIIRMLDGKITNDSSPIENQEDVIATSTENHKKKPNAKKPSMSFATSFGLSLKNLFTKKGRTILTSFAGSIGIIGIALIFAVSNGMTTYINTVQEDTLSSYPLTLEAQHIDMGSLLATFMGSASSDSQHKNDAVYQKGMIYDMVNSLNNMDSKKNDLKTFKTHIENELGKKDSEGLYGAVNGVQYTYNMDMIIYTKNVDGTIIHSDTQKLLQDLLIEYFGMDLSSMMSFGEDVMGKSMTSGFASFGNNSAILWQELLSGENGKLINPLLEKQYDVIYGSWPTKYNEIVLVVDENNEIDDMALYALGLKSKEDIDALADAALNKKSVETKTEKWSYEEICNMKFKTVFGSDCYTYDEKTETFVDLRKTQAGLKYLYDNGTELKVSGIIRPNDNSVSAMIKGSIGYTNKLTEYVIENSKDAVSIKKQLENPKEDIFTGLPFKENTGNLTEKQKVNEFKEYIKTLTVKEKAETYKKIMSIPSKKELDTIVKNALKNTKREDMEEAMKTALISQMGMSEDKVEEYIVAMTDEDIEEFFTEMITQQTKLEYAQKVNQQLFMVNEQQLAAMFDASVKKFTNEELATYYDEVLEFSESSYEDNLRELSYVDLENPASINIYASSFENKEIIENEITNYNSGVDDLEKITYTDYVGIMMSSITTIINAITYVLIAFVAVSLVVSSIMIGVITLISVQERTKEIGILRAIGASKRNVSRMFNAETIIIGFTSGLLGVLLTYLLCIPINIILNNLTGIENLKAYLPVEIAIALIIISVILTLFSGIIPSRSAAKKDPVVALRTE